ncbi:alpha/beta hydrolase [Basilea psittacipulmonis]|uniref:Alpha/beta hydrolase n=1 Tax=Basilea psittacipulmonis DSM 24701 TaxID=1072685 RepID=A0A077DCU9_9BURK|nr:alpha/beta hydrolase [Basilea psittacipulmonis]AIL32001.1 alpha/beta hydrolase [Basilea psittacipulmonis DSM 24701]
MNPKTMQFQGQVGIVDCAIDWPTTPEITGWALLLHPHPLYDGSRDNKVITTMARLCTQLGFVVVRPNFRGVGLSEGVFDKAHGETFDMLAVYEQFLQTYPELMDKRFVLGGFSFGTAVATQLYNELKDRGLTLPDSLVLTGPAVWRFTWREIVLPAENTLVVHGENDEVVPLQEVFDWFRPYHVPVVVVPESTHFFHGNLIILKRLVHDFINRLR